MVLDRSRSRLAKQQNFRISDNCLRSIGYFFDLHVPTVHTKWAMVVPVFSKDLLEIFNQISVNFVYQVFYPVLIDQYHHSNKDADPTGFYSAKVCQKILNWLSIWIRCGTIIQTAGFLSIPALKPIQLFVKFPKI